MLLCFFRGQNPAGCVGSLVLSMKLTYTSCTWLGNYWILLDILMFDGSELFQRTASKNGKVSCTEALADHLFRGDSIMHEFALAVTFK